jgi:hypothetical protein
VEDSVEPTQDVAPILICGNNPSFYETRTFAISAISWVFVAILIGLYWRYKGRSDWWAGGVMSLLFSPFVALPIGMVLKPNVASEIPDTSPMAS